MAQKQYNVATRSYEALPRSKRLRARGGNEASHRNAGGSVTVIGSGDGHSHSNKSVLDAQSMDAEGYLYLKRKPADGADSTTEKVKAGWADKSDQAKKAEDSTKWDGKQFADYLDQPLRKEDSVNFLKVIAQMFSTPDYKKGDMNGGAGAAVYKEGDSTVMEIDKLIVRKEASFSEVVINQTTFQLGETVFSRGGCSLISVDEFDDCYRCYFDNKNGKRYSGFAVGDLARCQRFDASYGNVIKYYWRKVVNVDDDNGYVDLSRVAGEYDGTGVPEAGDDIVHFGNTEEKTRQSALVISPLNGGSLNVLSGINSFSLSGTDYVGLGVKYDQNTSSYKAYIYGYGDMYFGSRPGTENAQYIEFVNGQMNIKANVSIGPNTEFGDTTLGDALESAGGNKVFSFDRSDEVPSYYRSGDLWIINTQHYPSAGNDVRCPDGAKDGEIWVAINNYNPDELFQVKDWERRVTYTDNTVADAAKINADKALEISSVYNDDGYLTPSEKRTLRQMMYELSDSEGVAEPYWAEISHETMVKPFWYRVRLGDKSNDELQDNWVGWWSSNSVDKHNTSSLQAVTIDSKSNDRTISILYASDAESWYDYLTIESKGAEIGTTRGNQNTTQRLNVLLTKGYSYYDFIYHKDPADNEGTDAGYYKIEGEDAEYWAGNTQYLCYKGSYPTLYAALYSSGKFEEANELKKRFATLVGYLTTVGVYGDKSEEKTNLEDVYADFRQDFAIALNDYYNYVEVCNLNDVDYLKKVFPNAVLNSNGAILSQLLAVKDGTDADANIVAGLYGGGSYDLNKNTGLYDHDIYEDEEQGKLSHEGHGALMIFAGANGIDNVSESKTRIYEDGHAVFNDVEATGGFKSSSGGKRIEVHSTKDGRDAGMYIYADREIAPLSENDSMEVLAASFTSERKRISDLFSAEAKTITLQSRSFSHNQSYAQESAQEEIVLGNITVDVAGGVLKIPQITGDIIISDEEGISTSASVYVDIIVNGTVIHTEGLYGRSGEQASKNFTIAAQQRPAPTGDLSITARFRYGVSEATLGIGHTFSATVTPNGNAVVDYSQYLASYFANGFALGSSATNLFAVINDGASMIMRSIADNYGINITRDGLQLRLGGGWYDATYDSSNNCLRLMPASGINN